MNEPKIDGVYDLATLANMQRPPMPLRRLKRYLQKLQARIRAALPDSKPFLLQPAASPKSKYLVDLSVLRVYVPGFAPTLEEVAPSNDTTGVRELVEETLSTIRDVREDTAVIRRAVGR